MTHYAFGVWAIALMLGGCSGGEKGQAEGQPDVPAVIQDMLAADFPADGEIHVTRSKGSFDIRPDTYFCTFRPGYGLDGRHLRDALQELGQSAYLDGAPRTNCQIDERTSKQNLAELKGGAIFMRMEKRPNRHGRPYKLVLAVWQGNPATDSAIWVGGIERLNGLRDEHIAIAAEDPASFERYSTASAGRDAGDLSSRATREMTDRNSL